MRIAVIGHALRTAGGLSVGRGLIESLAAAAPGHDYLFLVPDDAGYESAVRSLAHAQVQAVPAMGPVARLHFDRVKVPAQVRRFKPDVILALDSSHGLVHPPCSQAVLVLAAHLVYPPSHYGPTTLANKARHRYLKRHFRRELRRTDLVFCQTDVIASRVRSEFSYRGATEVVGTAAPPTFGWKGTVPPAVAEARPGVLKLLYVTQYYPHKNLEGAVRMFDRFRAELSDVVLYVTLETSDHPNVAPLLREVERRGLASSIVNLGRVPQPGLGLLMQACDALFQPTLLESFSTTYVEAMAAGLPILTSDLDFARESCGAAAWYFDPWDPASMSAAILRFRADPNARQRLREAAHAGRGQGHSWTTIARQVMAGLERIGGSGFVRGVRPP